MQEDVKQITRYFAEIQHRANLNDVDFGTKAPYRAASPGEIKSGTISEYLTAELFQIAGKGSKGGRSKDQKRSLGKGGIYKLDPEAKPINVVISLVTLRQKSGYTGLLLLPASLRPDGKLSADFSSAEPWIPATRLRKEGIDENEIMCGDLKAFSKWRYGKGREEASNVSTWSDSVEYAQNMYAAVSGSYPSGNEALSAEVEIIAQECYIVPQDVIHANGAILDLYDHLQRNTLGELKSSVDAPLYEKMLSLEDLPRSSEDHIDEDAKRLLENAQRATGSMSDEYPLTASQRRALHAFMEDLGDQTTGDRDGKVTTVSGPPGTGKTTLLQSVVATLLVKHALDQKPAPLIVGTSTNNQAVTNVIDSFSSVTKEEPGLLDFRWLPKASEDGASHESLQGIATYCPSTAKKKSAEQKYLVEDKKKSGVYSKYSAPNYTEIAERIFLAKCANYFQSLGLPAPKDLDQASNILSKVLIKCDRMRLQLLKLRAEIDDQIGPRTSVELEGQTQRLAATLASTRDRLQEWEETLNSPLEEELVELVYQEEEPASLFATRKEFVDFYRSQFENQYNELSELTHWLDSIKAKESELIKGLQEAFKAEFDSMSPQLKSIAQLSPRQLQKIEESNSLGALDQALDISLRYSEFWLAVHYYEAQWLIAVTGEDLIDEGHRFKDTEEIMVKYWRQVASLTPCFVMTVFQLPKYFKLYSPKGEASVYDLNRADLLIVDEAGQIDTSLGAAAFALAKRAVVVGDIHQLAPVWSIDTETDRQVAGLHGFSQQWSCMEERGMTASDHSSVMKCASFASSWCYGPDNYAGLFLAEHFRCHEGIIQFCNDLIYNGLLIPSRPLGNYALANEVTNPFQYHVVKGSQDRTVGSSRVNDIEAQAIVDWIGKNFEHYRNVYNPDHDLEKDKKIIGVVTPFAAQARLIGQFLRQALPNLASNITVGTAHRLQGAERSVILFSSVYGENSGQASFINATKELINVAVSRAKDLLIVFCSKGRLDEGGDVFKVMKQFATPEVETIAAGESEKVLSAVEESIVDHYQDVGQQVVVRSDEEPLAVFYSGGEPEEVSSTPEIGEGRVPWESSLPYRVDTKGQNWQPPIVVQPQNIPDSVAASSEYPGLNSLYVDRNTPGFLVGSQIVKRWKEAGVAQYTVKQFNSALERAGLLSRTAGSWRPTANGAKIGIRLYEGVDRDGNNYTNITYSPDAQEALLVMFKAGRLPSH